jgi:phosphoribosylformylglycinamidine synthase
MIISTGICQRYVQDEYSMAAMAFDIAVRKALATGAKFGYLAGLANFSWPDPLKSNKTVDGEQKLGGLVRSCIAIYDCATSYGVPIIASRSNLKNDHYAGGIKYSIPPTILVTIMGKSTKKIGPEFKNPGDLIYVLGTTRNELGGSEFYRLFGGVGNDHPQIYPDEHLPLYKAISAAIEEGLVLSAHTVSDGGLAVAFAKCALGNSFGAELDLDRISKTTEDQTTLMFSESAGRLIVSVKLEDAEKFENIMKGTNCVKAGRVRGDKRFLIKCDQDSVINESIEDIKTSYLKGVKIAQ